MTKLLQNRLFAIVFLLIVTQFSFAQTTFKMGGYVKFDNIMTQYKDGTPASALLNDFHLPSLIPVGGEESFYNEFHVKESRFNFDLSSKLNGKPIRTFIEMDFMLSPGGNMRVSNSYNPRMRHFFIEYSGLTIGQTWSTFMIVSLPNDLDFVGAAEGVVFIRQPLVRYTLKGDKGSWQFALENPQFTSTIADAGYSRDVVSGSIPDMVIRKNFKPSWGSFSIAAIMRGINYFDSTDTKQITPGYGITAGGKINVRGTDRINMVVTAGNGLGRYVGLNFLNAALLDTTNTINTINSFNGSISYLLHWSEKLQSSFSASVYYGDNSDFMKNTGLDKDKAINKNAQSYSVNLLYYPAPKLMFGIEYMYADRELQSGAVGKMNRVQLSAKYIFGFSYTSKPQE